MRLVYVAGPYSSDPEANTAIAMDVGDRLEDSGAIAVFTPHLSHFRHQRKARDYEHWMKVDLLWLAKCEALHRIPGESSGAEREVVEAKRLHLPIFHDEESTIAWARGECCGVCGKLGAHPCDRCLVDMVCP